MGCPYPGCSFQKEESIELCLFHKPAKEKGMSVDDFNAHLNSYLQGGLIKMDGFIFPGPIDIGGKCGTSFKGAEFHGKVSFRGQRFKHFITFEEAKFFGGVEFNDIKFSHSVSFRKAQFRISHIKQMKTSTLFNFSEIEFTGGACFTGTHFDIGLTYFDDVTFKGDSTDFWKTRVGGKIQFSNCKFLSERTSFSEAKFFDTTSFVDVEFSSKEGIRFDGSEFHEGELTFNRTNFSGKKISFRSAIFDTGVTLFDECEFHSKTVTFLMAEFNGENFEFINCSFQGKVDFSANPIKANLAFVNIELDNQTTFRFVRPSFAKREKPILIRFNGMQFNPLRTFFVEVKLPPEFGGAAVRSWPVILFRHCNLREAYFLNNDMSLFSFHQSAFFEETFFTSSTWQVRREKLAGVKRFTRRYQCYEDLLLAENAPESIDPIFPREHGPVSEIYLRLKASADKAKDYHMASWFYFNEFEMKKRDIALKVSYKKSKLLAFVRRQVSASLWQYRAYKLFAGYGEKPLWSFVWFWVFTFSFAFVHLLCGFKFGKIDGNMQEICYRFCSPAEGWQTIQLKESWGDAGSALVFTLYKVIPISYSPGFKLNVESSSGPQQLLSLANSVVLILFVIFTSIGLKRHFRRF